MNQLLLRRCKSCQEPLPEDARPNRKYCSDMCRHREKVRRFRERHNPQTRTTLDRLEATEAELAELQNEHRKLTSRVADRDRKIRRLEHALRRAEIQLESVAAEQAQRTRAVRDELAMANTEVAALRRNWSRRAAAATDSQEVTELRERLAAVTQRYESLVAKYRELSEAARYAATERKHLQGIVRQWDAMCVRLYKATGGRPKREADKKVLATWSQFRELVRK